MAESEVLDLIQSLEALKAQAPPAKKEPRTSQARLRVVLDDVTTLIVQIHAQEIARQLQGESGLGPEAREWSDETFARIQRCAPLRFEGRGPNAYRDAAALVQKHRDRLEPLVLELGRWRPDRGGSRAPGRRR